MIGVGRKVIPCRTCEIGVTITSYKYHSLWKWLTEELFD